MLAFCKLKNLVPLRSVRILSEYNTACNVMHNVKKGREGIEEKQCPYQMLW